MVMKKKEIMELIKEDLQFIHEVDSIESKGVIELVDVLDRETGRYVKQPSGREEHHIILRYQRR
jgi:hypothetical protein